jgi:hypothetical protein
MTFLSPVQTTFFIMSRKRQSILFGMYKLIQKKKKVFFKAKESIFVLYTIECIGQVVLKFMINDYKEFQSSFMQLTS